MRVLSYESDFNQDWENGLLNGDRKVIYPIYYFLLKNLGALRKKAYLAKFLVPIEVPQEFEGDPELKKLNEQFTELKVEFQVAHEEFEAVESSSLVIFYLNLESFRTQNRNHKALTGERTTHHKDQHHEIQTWR